MASARLRDGFKTTITFANGISLYYETDVTPPGVEGGGANDTTTMRNTTWRTRQPKALRSLSNASFNAAYDPTILTNILAQLQVVQLITITFPDNSTWAFYGWLDEFKPGALKEGEQPTAMVTVIPSNQTSAFVETAPVITAG